MGKDDVVRYCKRCGTPFYVLYDSHCGLCRIRNSVMRLIDADGDIDCPEDDEFMVSLETCKSCKRYAGVAFSSKPRRPKKSSKDGKILQKEFIWCHRSR